MPPRFGGDYSWGRHHAAPFFGPAGLFLGCLVVFFATGYAIGLFQTFGYEDSTEKFESGRPLTGGGTTMGPKHMLFFEGQTFFAAYETAIREGSLRIGMLRTWGTTRGPHHVEEITSDGSGEVTFRIEAQGFCALPEKK